GDAGDPAPQRPASRIDTCMKHTLTIVSASIAVALVCLDAQGPPRPKVLILADTNTGNTHESLGHAMATIDMLGHNSGLWDTYIRTDSAWINKQPLSKADRGRRVKNLDDFAAVVMMSN